MTASADPLVISDAATASRLHARLGIGTLASGHLTLQPVEAAWAMASGRIPEPQPGALSHLLSGQPELEVAFLAYSDLRDRGLPVRPAGNGLAVWERGWDPQRAPQAPPAYTVDAWAEREAVPWTRLWEAAQTNRIAAVVDDDGQTTYYRLSPADPRGEMPAADLPRANGTVLSDRVLVEGAAAAQLHAHGLGTLRDGRLVLSFVEAAHLARAGHLDLPASFPADAARRQAAFAATLDVYDDLRRRGVMPKSGLKFGAHLRAYVGDPDRDHARWLVHCCERAATLAWSDLARGVRLAHGVRKTFLAACAEPAQYVALAWFKP